MFSVKNGEYEFNTLYNKNRVWTAYIKSNIHLRDCSDEYIDNKQVQLDVYIYAIYGVENGKMIISELTQVYGKNKGRKNETTNLRQAIQQADSLIKKKVQAGYSLSKENNLISEDKLYYPMALDLYSKENLRKKINYPVSIQPKLDGVRALMVLNHTAPSNLYSIEIFSRRLHPIEGFELVKDECKTLINSLDCERYKKDTLFLDGEFYIHGKPLQDISGIVRKENKNAEISKSKEELEYHVFDICMKGDKGFLERYSLLQNLFNLCNLTKVKLVETVKCNNEEETDIVFNNFINNGYEGVVYKSNTSYEYSADREKRSSLYLKRKKQMDAEFEIVDFSEGKGKFKETIIFTLRTESGKLFNCVPTGTSEYRKNIYKDCMDNFSKYKGKLAKVKFDDYSKDMTPVRAVIVQIGRDLSFD